MLIETKEALEAKEEIKKDVDLLKDYICKCQAIAIKERIRSAKPIDILKVKYPKNYDMIVQKIIKDVDRYIFLVTSCYSFDPSISQSELSSAWEGKNHAISEGILTYFDANSVTKELDDYLYKLKIQYSSLITEQK